MRSGTRGLIGAALIGLLAVIACVPVAARPQPADLFDPSPGKILFSIQTRGGVASPLQELTALPDFVLYGDGTAIWTRYNGERDLRMVWSTKLSADEVRKELDYIESVGYNGWYDRYEDTTLPNLPTTTFTLNFKEQPIKRLVYGLQFALKAKTIPDGFGTLFAHFSQFKHPDEAPYAYDRIMLFARKLTKLEAKRGFRTLGWGVKGVNLADFARDGATEYGQRELSGKDAERVAGRLRKWTLFSTDLSVIFFREKKADFQVGYRPLLPGE